MRLPRFEYYAPETLEAALSLLEDRGEGAFVMAGGTDMMVKMSHGRLKPKTIISLKSIPGMDMISFDPANGMMIGATTRLADILTDLRIETHYPALIQAVQTMANVEVRNMATLAGNICNAAPSADSAPPLMVMNAEVSLASVRGERRLPLSDFFRGPGLTLMQAGEIMTSIHLPAPQVGRGASYMRISARCGVDIAAVGVGVEVRVQSGVFSEARIVLGAVAPVPLRASGSEASLIGKPLNDETLELVSDMAAHESRPISDVRASADYRKRMVAVLTRRAITQAYERSTARHS